MVWTASVGIVGTKSLRVQGASPAWMGTMVGHAGGGSMGNLTIGNLDDGVIDRLKAQAKSDRPGRCPNGPNGELRSQVDSEGEGPGDYSDIATGRVSQRSLAVRVRPGSATRYRNLAIPVKLRSECLPTAQPARPLAANRDAGEAEPLGRGKSSAGVDAGKSVAKWIDDTGSARRQPPNVNCNLHIGKCTIHLGYTRARHRPLRTRSPQPPTPP